MGMLLLGGSIASGGTLVLQCQVRLLVNTQDMHLTMQLLAKSLVCCPLTMLLFRCNSCPKCTGKVAVLTHSAASPSSLPPANERLAHNDAVQAIL